MGQNDGDLDIELSAEGRREQERAVEKVRARGERAVRILLHERLHPSPAQPRACLARAYRTHALLTLACTLHCLARVAGSLASTCCT